MFVFESRDLFRFEQSLGVMRKKPLRGRQLGQITPILTIRSRGGLAQRDF